MASCIVKPTIKVGNEEGKVSYLMTYFPLLEIEKVLKLFGHSLKFQKL